MADPSPPKPQERKACFLPGLKSAGSPQVEFDEFQNRRKEMATTFDDVYNQAKQELYEQQATLARDRLRSIPTKDLPAELQRAEQTINMHHEKEETDDIVRLLLPHMRTCAIQEVAIIKEVMALRAR